MKSSFRVTIVRSVLCLGLASAAASWCAAEGKDQSWIIPGQLERQLYTNVPGVLIQDLVTAAKFPDEADFLGSVDSFETPSLSGDNYGERVTGFLVPPLSGEYVFYLASDDQGELYLSTDPWAAHKTRIAFEPEWAFPRTWTGPASGRTNQENISSPIRLEAGQLYFVEGLHKEGWGGDNFGAAWQIPGAPAPENGSSPIGSEFLARPGPGFDENAPVVRLFFPTNGTVLDSGSGIALAAYAQHPVEDLTNVEFFVDNVPLGRGLEVMGSRRYLYLLGWSNAPAGEHMIAAAASDSAGRTTTTTPVLVTVLTKPPGPGSFVNRTILRNSVRLVAEPESGVSVYAIEEQQPVGWSAGNIGQDGAFDQFTGKVKFGPFFDHQARTLTYDSVPPVGFVGIGHVSGKASADGLSTPITGDDQVSVVIPHPADSSPADWRMELDEVTAYAAAWRTGGVWRLAPEVIPIEYVTRAAALWRGGEQYTVDATYAPPLCWVNVLLRAQMPQSETPAQAGSATRHISPGAGPAGSVEVQLESHPGAATLAFALEESVPPGSCIFNISQGGQLDIGGRKVKWGPFSDAAPRTFTYQCTLPTDKAELRFFGSLSCDGTILTVGGPDGLRSAGGWVWSTRPTAGKWSLILTNPRGTAFEIQSSTNLIDWQPLTTISNTLRQVEIPVDTSSSVAQKYFRARVTP